MRSPLIIELLIMCNTGQAAANLGRRMETPAVREGMAWLANNELILPTYKISPKGECWLQAMAELPLPVERITWVMK